MTEPRLAPGFEASAIVRRAELEGGFAAVLHRGDADRGTILLVVSQRGVHHACLARLLSAGGSYEWTQVGPDSRTAEIRDFLSRRVRNDPDEWQIELDIPSAERFIAETTATG